MSRVPLILLAGAVALVPVPTSPAAFPGLSGFDKLKEAASKLDSAQKAAREKAKSAQETAGKVGRAAKVFGLSLDEELAIGDAVSIEIASRFGGLWRDDDATRRVNLLGRALARYATRQDLDWRFGLLDTGAINAFSAPGGRVFISRGLYQLAATDDKLAGVLAHEIEHIDCRHAVRSIALGEGIAGGLDLLSERSKDVAKYDEVISSFTRELLEKGFDPPKEYEADERGRALARTTGFAPGGLRAVLEALQKSDAGRSAETFSTHPPLADRLQKLPKDPPPPAPDSAPAG